MLIELTIQDFAIIDRIQVGFGPGFTVLTGETGAGKSIIIDAVSLLLGGRGDSEVIRSGADTAFIEGVFTLDRETQSVVAPLVEREGLEGDSRSSLLLAREIRREGRNVCRVNGRAVTLKVLEEIGQFLVDIHGQTEHLSLMRVREHIDLLDRFAELWPLRQSVADLARRLRDVRNQLAALRSDERELARRMDLLQHQVHEIEVARLELGEEQDLAQERTRLANAEQLRELSDEAYLALFEGSDEQASAVDLLQVAARALAGTARLDPSASTLSESVRTLNYQLEDIGSLMRGYRDTVESNPRRLDQVEERLAVIHRLKRKYGDTVHDVLLFAERAQEELEAIEHSGERIAALEADEDQLLHEIGIAGRELSEQRREAGKRLSAGIERELQELNMSRARFEVDLRWREADDGAYVGKRRLAFDSTGLDRIEFLVSPNPGEPLKPLVRIASGGETSRLMLALKTVLAKADRTPSLIFDEIDAGIGGRVGAIVGQKLWGLTVGDGQKARCHQVLCVTHLPQLASYGDQHMQVHKSLFGERTVTGVREVQDEDRVLEIAAMLGTLTDRTQASAREMLSASHEAKKQSLAASDDRAAIA